MKRSPLKRSTPLRRSKPLRYRPKPRPGSDPAYLARVRAQGCAVGKGCRGRVHAHHSTTGRGLGQKAPDRESFPLCALHHDSFHQATGYFEGWDRARRRAWQAEQVLLAAARMEAA